MLEKVIKAGVGVLLAIGAYVLCGFGMHAFSAEANANAEAATTSEIAIKEVTLTGLGASVRQEDSGTWFFRIDTDVKLDGVAFGENYGTLLVEIGATKKTLKAYTSDIGNLTLIMDFKTLPFDAKEKITIGAQSSTGGTNGVLKIRKNFSFVVADGKVLEYKEYTLTVEGTVRKLHTLDNIGTLPDIPEKEHYQGYWAVDEEAITADTEWLFSENKSAVMCYAPIPYTVTIVNGGMHDAIRFGAELDEKQGITATIETIGAAVKARLPEPSGSTAYVWSERFPETFEWQDYTFAMEKILAQDTDAVYKFSLYRQTSGTAWYLDGNTSGGDSYLTMTDDVAKSRDFYAELTDYGYKFYTMLGGKKAYISLTEQDGRKVTYCAETDSFYKYDGTRKCWYANVNGTEYYLGAYTKAADKAFVEVGALETSTLTAANSGVTCFPLALQRIYVVTVVNGASKTTFEALQGDEIRLADPETTVGKIFLGWSIENAMGEYADVPAAMPAEDIAVYAVWAIEAYSVTIVNGETVETILFGVELDEENGIDETPETIAAAVRAKLPEDTAEYTYAWAESIPDAFELKNYLFVINATETSSPNASSSKDTSVSSDSTSRNDSTLPSGSVGSSDEGCSGSTGGITSGLFALVAAFALLKRKREDEV